MSKKIDIYINGQKASAEDIIALFKRVSAGDVIAIMQATKKNNIAIATFGK